MMTAEQARQALRDRISAWLAEGRQDFTTADLTDLWTAAGLSRSWTQKQIGQLRQDGVLGYDDNTQRHLLIAHPDAA
jgi:hypothetical protein